MASTSGVPAAQAGLPFSQAGEPVLVNIGPQHPSTNGVLRLRALLDGEVIIDLEPVFGYLHSSMEKLAELRTYTQAITLTDRMDYLAAMSNNLAACLAIEKLADIPVPERALYLRLIMVELQRIASHCMFLGTYPNECGAWSTPWMYSFRDREKILELHTQDKPLAKDIDLRVVAERTPGFSGADLANLVNEAAILAARLNQTQITQHNILQSIERVILGPERRSHILSKKEKEITAYHEAGHALVAASLPHSDPVHKVSIVARGRAGGYTLKLPSQDRHLRSRSEFESELAVLLAGYAAERTIFNELTTGASNDLRVASDLARKMVTQFGMSDLLGPIVYGEKEELVFLGKEMTTQKNYSESIALTIDKEVKRFIIRGLNTAKKILVEKGHQLQKIAKVLIEKETLEQKEFYALLKA